MGFVGLFHRATLGVSKWHLAKAHFSNSNSMSPSQYSALSYLLGRQECDSKKLSRESEGKAV